MYRVAELEHILCTASWSQVAKCVPIHSLNITTCIHICIHAFFMIFKFYEQVSSMWGKLNWENKACTRWDFFPSSRKMETPNFSVCLCLIHWDQILLSVEERKLSRQNLFTGTGDLPHNMNFWHKIIHFHRTAHRIMYTYIIWAALEQ